MQTSVIVGKFSQLIYTSVCARDRKRDREKEKASRGKGELVEYYEEGKKEGRIDPVHHMLLRFLFFPQSFVTGDSIILGIW